MKQIIRLTESDLNKIIKESVKNIIREWGDDEREGRLTDMLDDRAYQEDLRSERERQIEDYWAKKNRRLREKFPGKSEEWYEAMIDMFNENTIKEDAAGGGATNCAAAMQTGCGNAPTGTNPEAGQYTVPFGKMQRRKIYSPKGDAKGDVTKQESNVDMSPAMARKNGKGGSISIPKRTNESKKKIDEGWFKNAAMAGAMAGMMGAPQTANAAPQDDMYNVGRNKTTQKAQPQNNRNMTITTNHYGSGTHKNDTVYWDNVKDVTPELHQRLTDLYNNGKLLMSSPYRGDIIDMIKNDKPNSISPNSLYWGSYEVVDTSNEAAMINSIQSAGLSGLKSTNPKAYYGIVNIGSGTYIVGMSASNYTSLPQFGLKH